VTATAQIKKYKKPKRLIEGGIESLKAAIVILSSCLFTSACMKDESFYPGKDTESSGESDSDTDPLEDSGDKDTGGEEDTALDSDTDSAHGTEHASMDSDGDAPVADKSHNGWKNPSCMLSACHGDIDSPVETSAGCAQCHGDNGAPPCAKGNTSYCFDCHSSPHSKKVGEVEADCIICHV
jgi:hypothetical protein